MRGGGSRDCEMVEGPMLGKLQEFMKGAEPYLWENQIAFFGKRSAQMLDASLTEPMQ
jgi:hypothetical protein